MYFNRYTTLLSNLAMGSTLAIAALSTASAFAESMPAIACHAFGGVVPRLFGEIDDFEGRTFVVCPVPVVQNSTLRVRANVIDTSSGPTGGTGDVSCVLRTKSVSASGGVTLSVVSRSTRGFSSRPQTLVFPAIFAGSSAAMECSLPGRRNGNVSQLIDYSY